MLSRGRKRKIKTEDRVHILRNYITYYNSSDRRNWNFAQYIMNFTKVENYRFISFDVLLARQFGIEITWNRGQCRVKYDDVNDTFADDLGIGYFRIMRQLRAEMTAQNANVASFKDPHYFSIVKHQVREFMYLLDWDVVEPYVREHRPEALNREWAHDVRERFLFEAVFDMFVGEIPLKPGSPQPLKEVDLDPAALASYLNGVPAGIKFKPGCFEQAYLALGHQLVEGYVCGEPVLEGGDTIEDIFCAEFTLPVYPGYVKLAGKVHEIAEKVAGVFKLQKDNAVMVSIDDLKQHYRRDAVPKKVSDKAVEALVGFSEDQLSEMIQYFVSHCRMPTAEIRKVLAGDQGSSTRNQELLATLTKREMSSLRTINAAGMSLRQLFDQLAQQWKMIVQRPAPHMLFAGIAVEYGSKFTYHKDRDIFEPNGKK